MNIINFFKRSTELGSIYEIESLANPLNKLAIFLSIEVDCFGSDSWINFFNTANDGDETSGNMMSIEKKGQNIYISDVYYNGPESKRTHFAIATSDLINLMKIWEKLMKEKPEKIILSSENDKFKLIGKNLSKQIIHEDVEY